MLQCDAYIYGLRERFDVRIRYIGKTCQLRARLKQHLTDPRNCHRTNWIRSVINRGGVIELVILQKVPAWASWQKCERMWIRHAIRSFWPLTNSTSGGEGLDDPSDEVRRKISESQKGRIFSEEHKKNLSDAHKGKQCTEEFKAHMRVIMKGRTRSPEHCANLSRALKGNQLGFRKIGLSEAREILGRLKLGETTSSLAIEYGVNSRTIYLIKCGRWCPTTLGKELYS